MNKKSYWACNKCKFKVKRRRGAIAKMQLHRRECAPKHKLKWWDVTFSLTNDRKN